MLSKFSWCLVDFSNPLCLIFGFVDWEEIDDFVVFAGVLHCAGFDGLLWY